MNNIDLYGWKVLLSQVYKIGDQKKSNIKIIGFDTEFSQENELLSLQFYSKGKGKLLPCNKLDFSILKKSIFSFLKSINEPINHKRTPTIVLITFFSIAELQHIKDLLKANIYETSKSYIIEYPLKKTKSGKVKQRLYIIDLFEWYPTSLAKLAKKFGMEKLDYDVTNLSKEDLRKSDFITYAINDAKLCYDIYDLIRNSIFEQYGVDIFRYRTVASTSMAIYRKDYLKESVNSRNFSFRRFILKCCWGGNNQAFYRGHWQGELKEYDAVSMYPSSVFKLGELPLEENLKLTWNKREFLSGIGGFAHIAFRFPDNCDYPCLPVFKEGKLIYPLSGISWCTLQELKLAIEIGCDIKFIRGIYYNEGDSTLSLYLTDMLEKRQKAKDKGDLVESELLKLFMNAIIGKFIQKTWCYDLNEIIRFAEETGLDVKLLMKVQNLEKFGITKNLRTGAGFIPEWNGLITGYARATLSKAFYENQALVGTTDSLIIDGGIKDNIINGIEFEKRNEGTDLIIYRNRLYGFHNNGEILKLAHHGIHNREAARNILVDFLDEMWYYYKRSHIVKLKESLKGKQDFGVKVENEFKVYLGWDQKRVLQEDGHTVPLNN